MEFPGPETESSPDKKSQLQAQPRDKGSLEVSINQSKDGGAYWSWVRWKGFDNVERENGRAEESEFQKPPLLAWELKYSIDRHRLGIEGHYPDLDPEAGRNFQGMIPATVTVEGYAAEFGRLAATTEEPRPVSVSTAPFPHLTTKDLADYLNTIPSRHDLPPDQVQQASWNDIKSLLFTESPQNSWHPSADKKVQITTLLAILNRQEVFDDLRSGTSIGTIIYKPPGTKYRGIGNFLLQIILAYELSIRLGDDSAEFAGITPFVKAALELSGRWLDSVKCTPIAGYTSTVDFQSLVHERQIEGLIGFAEAISWPYLDEVREFLKDVYTDMRAGHKKHIHLWDWLYAAVLPGNHFVFTIMSALVAASPSLPDVSQAVFITSTAFTTSSLVLQGRSYWQSRHVVGRILGGLHGMECVAGWVGPCPRVEIGIMRGWVRVMAKTVGFRLPEPRPGSGSHNQEERVNSISGSVEEKFTWIIPLEPPKATETCQLLSLSLRKLFSIEKLHGKDLAIDEEEYEASLKFSIDNKVVTYTLHNNPTFIAAPRCVNGPHGIHSRHLLQCQICNIRDLKEKHHNTEEVLVINATCGRGEVIARAWCSEVGRHAVIRRGTGTCFACAVKIAGDDGLGLNCLIWT